MSTLITYQLYSDARAYQTEQNLNSLIAHYNNFIDQTNKNAKILEEHINEKKS